MDTHCVGSSRTRFASIRGPDDAVGISNSRKTVCRHEENMKSSVPEILLGLDSAVRVATKYLIQSYHFRSENGSGMFSASKMCNGAATVSFYQIL